MKKRILSVVLCALLLCALFPGAEVKADDALSFLAVNDLLPPELINVAVSYGGVTYVPCWLFTNYSLGLYYSFMTSNSTAYLSTPTRQLYYEMSTGRTYDNDDKEYNASAIMWGGTVYFPLEFVAGYYGCFSCRMIGSNEYGSVLRICTGAEVLSDDVFFSAAQSAMRRYYQAWNKETPPVTPEPDPSQPPEPDPVEPTDKPSREGDTVRLGLDGMPSEETLALLQDFGVRATFFLSAGEIEDDPDMVRRIACEGYTLGISNWRGKTAECEAAADLLWETARVSTILAAVPTNDVRPDDMVSFPSVRLGADDERDAEELAFSVTSKLELRAGDQTLIFVTGGRDVTALRIVLEYLADMEFSVTDVRETDGGGTPIVP